MKTSIPLYLIFIFLNYVASEETQMKAKPTKRELSYSYAATDIGSKTGTRIKTITVIKNIAGKKDEAIKVNPEYHKDEHWGSFFRDNFDSFGKIPDIPEIYHKKEKEEKGKQKMEEKSDDKKEEIPIYEEPEPEPITEEMKMEEMKVEKKEEAKAEMQADEDESPKTEANEMSTAAKYRRVIHRLPPDTELVDIGPINTKMAQISAKSQSLRFKEYNSRISQPSEYDSEIYQQDHSAAKLQYDQPEESRFESAYTNYPGGSPYTILQPGLTTTTQTNPYMAPTKKQLQLLKKFETAKKQFVSTTNKPYLAPSLRKSNPATKPIRIEDDDFYNTREIIPTNNFYQGASRLRGLPKF